MKKFESVSPNKDGLEQERLHETMPQEDKYFKTSLVYVDLPQIESIEYCTPFKGSDCCNINLYSGDRFTLIMNMDKLAELVMKAKQQVSIMNYNN